MRGVAPVATAQTALGTRLSVFLTHIRHLAIHSRTLLLKRHHMKTPARRIILQHQQTFLPTMVLASRSKATHRMKSATSTPPKKQLRTSFGTWQSLPMTLNRTRLLPSHPAWFMVRTHIATLQLSMAFIPSSSVTFVVPQSQQKGIASKILPATVSTSTRNTHHQRAC